MVAFESKLNLLCVYRERTVAVSEYENFSTLIKKIRQLRTVTIKTLQVSTCSLVRYSISQRGTYDLPTPESPMITT
jgi:hypothetical protein